jgi:hypothetical protein
MLCLLFTALYDYFVSLEIVHLKGGLDSKNLGEHADL